MNEERNVKRSTLDEELDFESYSVTDTLSKHPLLKKRRGLRLMALSVAVIVASLGALWVLSSDDVYYIQIVRIPAGPKVHVNQPRLDETQIAQNLIDEAAQLEDQQLPENVSEEPSENTIGDTQTEAKESTTTEAEAAHSSSQVALIKPDGNIDAENEDVSFDGEFVRASLQPTNSHEPQAADRGKAMEQQTTENRDPKAPIVTSRSTTAPGTKQTAPANHNSQTDRLVALLTANYVTPENAGPLADSIETTSQLNGIDPFFAAAVIMAESTFKPDIVGAKGKVGLLQLHPVHAEGIARLVPEVGWRGAEALKDPTYNLTLGLWYLAVLKKEYNNDLELTLLAFNLGADKLHELQQGSAAVSPLAKRYVQNVHRYYTSWKHGQDSHEFELKLTK